MLKGLFVEKPWSVFTDILQVSACLYSWRSSWSSTPHAGVLPTDPTRPLFKTQSASDSPRLGRDNLGWNKEQSKEKPVRTLGTGHAHTVETNRNLNGHPCFQGENPMPPVVYLMFSFQIYITQLHITHSILQQ